MFVQYRIPAITDVAKKMTRFLIAQSADIAIGREEIPALVRILEAPQFLPKLQAAVRSQILARLEHVRPARVREAMPPAERFLDATLRAAHQHRPNALYRSQAHTSAGTGGEDAKCQFFKQLLVGSSAPYVGEFGQPGSDFSTLLVVNAFQ